MVVKLRKWPSWTAAPPQPSTATTRKFQVKIKPLKLDPLEEGENDEKNQRIVSIKVKWKGEPKFGLMPFHKHKKDFFKQKIFIKGEAIRWDDNDDDDDDQIVHICCFTIESNQEQKFVRWDVTFNILYGENIESKSKLAVIGRGCVNLAEIVSRMENQIELEIPIKLQNAGVAREVSLTVLMNFVEIKESQDSILPTINEDEKREERLSQEEMIMDHLEKSALFERKSKSSELLLDSNKKVGWFSWKRQFSKSVKHNESTLVKKTKSSPFDSFNHDSIQTIEPNECSSQTEPQQEGNPTDSWEVKEILSRDGQTKLKASVHSASFDQRSDKAAGESACTALVAVISHWLHSNPNAIPNTSQFDDLIIQGSSEWRKLCDNVVYVNKFPDRHFDLETILKANIRPMAISHEKSFVGFFGAEIFKSLDGVMSFDEIWDELSGSISEDCDRTRVYIISWNDHFFVLKMDLDAYYIIDTLGERLFEGCDRAYILRFDSSTVMHRVGENEEIVCSGKECCKEYMKRFLAVIQLKELQEDEEKKRISYFSLHNRLQIEFNFSYSSPSYSSSLTSSPFSSPATSTSPRFSSEECDR